MTRKESGPKTEVWRAVYPHLTALVDEALSRSSIREGSAVPLAQTLKDVITNVLELSLKDSEFKDPAQKAAQGDVLGVKAIFASTPKFERDHTIERAILYTAITVKMFMTGEPGEEEAYTQLIEEIAANQNPRDN